MVLSQHLPAGTEENPPQKSEYLSEMLPLESTSSLIYKN